MGGDYIKKELHKEIITEEKNEIRKKIIWRREKTIWGEKVHEDGVIQRKKTKQKKDNIKKKTIQKKNYTKKNNYMRKNFIERKT